MTGHLTRAIADHGVLVVVVLMALDALLPVGGELIMLYAGVALVSGATSYVGVSVAGGVGYLAGALLGWAIGRNGGRALIDRHGRALHLSPARFRRAEAWFERHGARAVFLGRITPLVRSFVSIPAGVLASPLPSYAVLTLLGSLLWCFAFAGAGWAVGGSWESVHHAFRYADYAAAAAVVLVAALLLHRRRATAASS